MKTTYFTFYIIGIFFNQYALADNETNSTPPQLPNFYWGASTNGISAGIYVETASVLSNVDNQIPVRLHPMLYDASTNNVTIKPNMTILFAPLLEDRCRLELRDENGKEVEKTARGKALGKKTPHPYRVKPNPFTGITVDTGWRPGEVFLLSREVRELTPPLLLSDYFKIKSAGKYHLHCELFMFKMHEDDKREQDLICFPPVDAEIDIKLNQLNSTRQPNYAP